MERLSVRPAAGRARAALVVVESLTKVYEPSPVWMRFLLRSAISEPVVALDSVSLSVPAGGITAIVGPNGAGKSTLFRVLTGLTSPTSGSARIDGVDVADAPRGVRAMIGFVPSGDQTLYLRLTCVDNLAFHGRLQGIPKRALPARIGEVLELVGLSGAADRVGFALSAGMRGRLQLARALLGRPRLLVLDEPTAAIDPVGAYELLGLVQAVAAEQGVSVLLSSHRLEEIEALGNHLVLMDRGRIVYDGGLAELRQRWQRPRLVLRFADPRPLDGVARLLTALDVEVLPGTGLEEEPGGSPSNIDTGDEIVVVTLGSSVSVGSVLDHLRPLLSDLVGVQEAAASLRDVIYGVLAGAPAHARRGDTRLGPDAAAPSTGRVVPSATEAVVGSDGPPERAAGLDAPSRAGR